LPEESRYPGLHVSLDARRRYELREDLLNPDGKAVFAHFQTARVFARQMNSHRHVSLYPERAVRASHLHGAGLIDRVLFLVTGLYQRENGIDVPAACHTALRSDLGEDALHGLLLAYVHEFPPTDVAAGKLSPEEYLVGETDGEANRAVVTRELLRFWLTDVNEAFTGFDDIYRSEFLRRNPAYQAAIASISGFFAAQPPFGPERQSLVDMLRAPAVAEPHSIPGQLDYIRRHWGGLLGSWFYALLRGMDFIAEEDKAHFGGPGETHVLDFARERLSEEPERFSPDREWMPRLILIAKSTYVWLEQLSRQYGRAIRHLDDIPDEELDRLRNWGFTGLWLIGVWERSAASRRLKRMLGRDDAIASAYSLRDYVIAADLGGQAALEQLKERAWQRGIRLASDMVPNHTGIDSDWVMQHPEWFVQSEQPPFPAYTFGGPDLGDTPGVGLRVEDHYYDRTDAAVVFQRSDENGVRYIYHGNDGTNMPWNDTAQLNYLLPQVREAVLDKIVSIARQFPIIRFDAAMTLARRHFQRLWFPEPGSGGDIPSRAEHGLTREQFEAAMPEEFWRQVVDRIAAQAPDTLLLAEAFWLMEGYFVRTLGMHRVYNSAFMNMLKNEENEKYRQTIRNVLEYNPEILKRLVNFMNNPDEETAIAQFGSDDKYFGVCAMMVTMPGLPMFGHGQVEGYTERYGMEYSKPMWDERPNEWLVRRHEREIFPLMKRRHLFADVRHFILYDFTDAHGHVNHNVFAYSNRHGNERALVLYNNRYDAASGWVRGLGEGLGLQRGEGRFTLFRDHIAGLQYIRRADDLFSGGLFAELGAFKYHVFLDFEEIGDDAGRRWAHLERYLAGRGVPDIHVALKETFLQPLLAAFTEVFSAERIRVLANADEKTMPALLDKLEPPYRRVMATLGELSGATPQDIWPAVRGELLMLADRDRLSAVYDELQAIVPVTDHFADDFGRRELVGWVLTHRLGEIEGRQWAAERSRSYFDEWLLSKPIGAAFQLLDTTRAEEAQELLESLVEHQEAMKPNGSWSTPLLFLQRMLDDTQVRQWLQVNRWRDVLWFNQERFEQMLGWMAAVLLLRCAVGCRTPEEERYHLNVLGKWLKRLWNAKAGSGYQVEKLLESLQEEK